MSLEELLHHMEQDLQLRGMSTSTQFNYLRAVRKYSEYFQRSPDQISEEQLRDYFIYLKNVKKFSRSASTQTMCGLKFFYTYTIEKDWPTFKLLRSPHEYKLPVVLTQEEVRRLLSSIRIFRGKFRDALKKNCPHLFAQVPASAWRKKWVVHVKAVPRIGKVLKYMAPYIFRVAISNKRLVRMENETVTFRYKDNKTRSWRLMTLQAEEFIRRFLQHVLSRGLPRWIAIHPTGPAKGALLRLDEPSAETDAATTQAAARRSAL
jgi:hypothetical protein